MRIKSVDLAEGLVRSVVGERPALKSDLRSYIDSNYWERSDSILIIPVKSLGVLGGFLVALGPRDPQYHGAGSTEFLVRH